MKLSNLKPAEFVGLASAGVLALSLWLPWFSTDCERRGVPRGCNQFSTIDGQRGDLNAWQSFDYVPYVLILACIAPVVLTYIVIRGHELSWPRGEMTTIVGILAFAVVILNGIVLGRPGENPVDVQLSWGYAVALLAALGIAVGGFLRQAENPPPPQPPGV